MKSFIISCALAITGMVAAQDNLFISNSDKMLRNLAGTAHTCTSQIMKYKAGLLADNYQSIIGSGQKYTDTGFTGRDTIMWSDYPNRQYPLSSYANHAFARLTTKYSPVLFGATTGPNDIIQGVASDCYALASAAAIASKPDRLKNIFITQTYNNEGIFALNVYIRGKPIVVTVDDNLPWYYTNVLLFAKQAKNGALWGPILEKAFAKVNGNYEASQVGAPGEFYKTFNGAPTFQVQMVSTSQQAAWNDIFSAVSNNLNVGANTPSVPGYGLVGWHAHSIIGAYELKNTLGQVTNRVLLMRDPHGTDTGFVGKWKDGSSSWTPQLQAQVPYNNNNKDGFFFIEDSEFYRSFTSYDVNHFHDGWFNQYYEVLNDSAGAQRTFSFTTTKSQEVFVAINFYPSRMYSNGCKTQATKGIFYVKSGSQQLSGIMFSDQFGGLGLARFQTLKAGTYTIQFKPTWTSVDVRDYTVNVYAQEKILVKDSNGNTNQV